MAEENLSIIYLIINASLLVQFVMALLLLASVTSWVMIVQRGISLRQSTENYRNFEDPFWSGQDLNIYYEDLIKRVTDIIDIYLMERPPEYNPACSTCKFIISLKKEKYI